MHEQPIHIGTRNSYGTETPVFLRPEDRRAHTYIVGKTGTGKSSLLKNIIEQDLAAGRGVALIDPHGDLAESLLDAIPRHRIGDVTYFNVGDTEFPVAWNILSIAAGDSPALIASGVVAAFKAIWRDFLDRGLMLTEVIRTYKSVASTTRPSSTSGSVWQRRG